MTPGIDKTRRHTTRGDYLLPQSKVETERLIRQARLLHNQGTRWLLACAGLTPGMRVLEVGSGAGDVAIVAAELVGATGQVVGVDNSALVLETARARAAGAGFRNVRFVDGDLHEPPIEGRFDALVGRSILAHLPDPVAALRGLLRYLKPGGIVAFREVDFRFGMFKAVPPSPTLEVLSSAMVTTAEQFPGHAAPASASLGLSLARVFLAAGLPFPELFIDAIAGGAPGWEGFAYLADMAHLFTKIIARAGLTVPAGLEDPDAFAAQVEAEVVAAQGVVKLQDAVNAWVRLSS